MKTLYELFETDTEMEKKGIGLKFGPATFFVRRAGGSNRDFSAKFNEKTRAMSSSLQLAALSPEQSDDILIEVFAESVILGWEGVTDREGKSMSFSRENFIKLMKDLPELWRGLRTAAADHDNFLKVLVKKEGEELGKS